MSGEVGVDLRLPLLAAVAWTCVIATKLVPASGRVALLMITVCGLIAFVRRIPPGPLRRTVLGAGSLGAVVMCGVMVRGTIVQESWVAVVARQGASAELVVEVRSDPRVRPGLEDDRATVRAEATWVEARGQRSTARVPVMLVLSAPLAEGLRVGGVYRIQARLASSPFPDAAATVIVRSPPATLRGPGWTDRAAETVRSAIRNAAVGQNRASGLVPALVDGDERSLPTAVVDDFQRAGLTHLLAVSGTNFVLLGSAWLGVARWCGARGRALVPLGLIGIVALVVLARAEPSVVRAALMGGVALLGLGQGQRAQGVRALSACVCLIMLFSPDLALSPGFALSALATGGILCFGGRWRDALACWMPGILAEAIAVTLAAYIACLPLIVAISGRLSLIAIPANLVAGVVVGPATVLGFLGGATGLIAPGLGRLVAAPAAWCAWWIVGVAHTAANLPHPDVGLGSNQVLLSVLVVVSIVVAVGLGWLLRRPLLAAPLLALTSAASLVTIPQGAWPPAGWVFVACDVGQGDGLVVRLGEGRALVIDTGPDPSAMRGCLRDLGIRTVPVLVLTHFHADHVNGLSGVLDGAQVGAIAVTDFAEPRPRAEFVHRLAVAAHVPIQVAEPGEQRTDGDATWEVLAPLAPPPSGSDSPPNDASVVILVRVRGIRILLMGDEETGSQTLLASTYPGIKADVLKVAHHGSAKQDPDLIRSLGAPDAIISAGRGNRYGLPKPATLALLAQAGMRVHRTDVDGPQAVIIGRDGRISVVARG